MGRGLKANPMYTWLPARSPMMLEPGQIPNIEPTVKLVPIMELPSKGSKVTVNLPVQRAIRSRNLWRE